MSLRESILSLLFILNGGVLLSCSIAYCIKWTKSDSQCGESQGVITSIFALASFVYGAATLASMAFYIFLYSKKCFRFGSMTTVILTFSCGQLVFAILAGAGMLISLYFGFDPSCLVNDKSKTDFVFLWLLAFYAVVSNIIFVILSVYNSFKEDQKEDNLPSKIYIISDQKV